MLLEPERCNGADRTDALGSPVAGTDEVGALVVRTTYEPYGAALNRTVDGVGYGGQVMDAATGLVYMQQRYYDPAIGRFLSADPVPADGNTGGNFNRYAYANNNPYRFIDPDGRYACAGNKIDCSIIRDALFDMRKAMSNLPQHSAGRTSLSNVVKFYGKENENNGVTVRIAQSSLLGGAETKDGKVTVSINLASEAKLSASQNASFFKSEVASTLAHEGQHGIDERRQGMPSNRGMEKAFELRAARTEAYVWQGLRIDSLWGTWTSATGLNQSAIEAQAESSTQELCKQGGGGCK